MSGSSPDWAFGYVPPPAEWNDWWARKFDGDDPRLVGAPFLSLAGDQMAGSLLLLANPVQPLEAATKSYVDTAVAPFVGSFLPLSGGTLTGSLLTNSTSDITSGRNLYCTNIFYVNAYESFEWYFTVDGVGNHVHHHRLGWEDTFIAASGVRLWSGNGTDIMNLDGSGNLNVLGTVNTGTHNASGNITATGNMAITGTITAGVLNCSTVDATGLAIAGSPWFFSIDGSADHIQQHAVNTFDVWYHTGVRAWYSNSVGLMQLDASGNLTVIGTVTATNVAALSETIAALTDRIAALEARLT